VHEAIVSGDWKLMHLRGGSVILKDKRYRKEVDY
jgi:hypothetical protein